MYQQPGPDNAIWDAGEWISWDEISDQIQYKEWRARYPNANFSLIPIFENLISTAEEYFHATGQHLQLYGDIGELYGAITHGIKLHRNYAKGSDGRLGNDFVEVKTITPFKRSDVVEINLDRHFSKVFIVRINENFEISGKLVNRRDLPKTNGKKLKLSWAVIEGT